LIDFYTNVVQYGNEILVRGIQAGQRFDDRLYYQPTLYHLYKDKTRYKSLDGKYLINKQFKSIKDAKEFIQRYEGHHGFAYGMERFNYQYMSDYYPGSIEYDLKKIKIFTIDIEVACEKGFPDPADASEEILCITIKNHNNGKIIVWGTDDYTVKKEYVSFVRCNSEMHMLDEFLKFWQDNCPDIITGWNSKLFDMAYVCNRIINLMGERDVRKLSPWNVVRSDPIEMMGKTLARFSILGVAQLDYMDLYKKLTVKNHESFKLDHIAEVELGKKKDENPFETFKEWYTNDYQSFVDYNIVDVELVDELEKKLKLIELCITMAYNAKVNYEDIYSQVRTWDCLIYNHLKSKNIIPPLKQKSKGSTDLVGAYVKDPQVGMHEWVVSFDLNSLYPHLIMQYNISPETIINSQSDLKIDKLLDKKYNLSKLKDNNIAIAANGTMYKTDKQGFLPEMLEKEYNDRVKYKKLMIQAQQEYQQTKNKKLLNDIAKYHIIQFSKKISLNSAYGAIGNQYFRYYDHREAEAITTSGQLAIRWIENKMNAYLNHLLKTKDKDYIIASDTDSIYINMSGLVKRLGDNLDKTKVVKALDKFCEEKVEPYIDTCYAELAEYMNAYQQKMFMKREVIADKGIWTAKKRYILNVHNSEGVQYAEPQLKIMGIEAVKSSTPAVCRSKIKQALNIIMSQSEKELRTFVNDFRQEFEHMPAEKIAFPRSVKGLKKYMDSNSIFRKSTPMHVKGSLIYNHILHEKKLLTRFQEIQEGDKIKYVLLRKPNTHQTNVISFLTKLPPQFNFHSVIDYETQFQKSFFEPLKFILEAINWKVDASGMNTIESFFE
jgi:DNA polymerase elongation subunit (family B)|tara:strand:- start:2406 stop:4898 length:2493 start_codon:yes stop_codon:yes gene_type:complete